MKKIMLFLILLLFIPSLSIPKVKDVEIKHTVLKKKIDRKENVIRLIKTISIKEGVDTSITLAIAKIESDFRPEVFNSNDPSHGLYQMAYGTAKAFNKNIKEVKDLYVVKENATAGINFIKYLLKTYKNLSVNEIAQIYNLGETKYRKGVRNAKYEEKFMKWYTHFNKVV